MVNIANTDSIELDLYPPISLANEIYSPEGSTYLLPISYTFGTINFVFTLMD